MIIYSLTQGDIMPKHTWINNAIIYQIYPLTFNYTPGSKSDPYNGAYGNLRGITEKADYIKSLDVDAIWINPFYKWNRNGFGYDITDHKTISPMFGTFDDLHELIQAFHSRNIKILIDQVLNHCSMQHPWFQASVQKHPKYSDFFVWAKPSGYQDNTPIPPNNWQSIWDSSGTSAWTWHPTRQEFYLHTFDYTIPDLNISNPAVQDELLNILKYWLDLGIDGFRLDAAKHFGHSPDLQNNPIICTPTCHQIHKYDENHPTGIDFINRIAKLTHSYDTPRVLLMEHVFTSDHTSDQMSCKNINTSKCDTFYTGALGGTLQGFKSGVSSMLHPNPATGHAVCANGAKINWATSNHDMERVASRWFQNNATDKKIKLAFKMLMALPGSICIFQGEELGLKTPDIEQIKNSANDPLNLTALIQNPWDAARTSIPWTSAGTNMWLRPTPEQCTQSAKQQNTDKNSILNAARAAIKWRKSHKILNRAGFVEFLETNNPDVIIFTRSDPSHNHAVLLGFNFTDKKFIIRHKNKIIHIPPCEMIQADIK